uniref:Uncharacterized protein n=1 Tax=Megaselia scalaris TaxID=36166 RepID=T1GSH4_MEGSC
MMLCRLTPPMCLNFLGLVHMDSHIIKERIQETHYSQVMGHMDVIGIIADGFNIYFPMCMLAFCLATWFSLGSRALSAMGFQQFLQNETIAIELVQEGKDLIAREKRRRQRAEEALARRRDGPSMSNSGKYRPFKSGFSERMTPSDGLLRDAEPFDYSTTNTGNRQNDMTRSLSEEITDRFGSPPPKNRALTLQDTWSCVKAAGGVSENFCQGDALSCSYFNILLGMVMRAPQIDTKNMITNESRSRGLIKYQVESKVITNH